MDFLARTGHQIDLTVRHRTRIILEVGVHETECRLANVGAVGVSADAHETIHHVPRAKKTVKPFQSVDDPLIGVHRKDRVLVAVHEEHRPGRYQRGDAGVGPLIRVVKEHAIAVAVDDSIRHIGLQVRHAADRHRRLHPFIRRRDPKRGRPAAADAGHSDPLRIHIRTADQIVDPANAVPAFDTGGRVAARQPPPAPFAIGAVMNAGDLPKLQRINHQTNIAMPGEPDAVGLKRGLVAVASTPGMSANIENRRQPLSRFDLRRPI